MSGFRMVLTLRKFYKASKARIITTMSVMRLSRHLNPLVNSNNGYGESVQMVASGWQTQ
jgi:hypothetical protein